MGGHDESSEVRRVLPSSSSRSPPSVTAARRGPRGESLPSPLRCPWSCGGARLGRGGGPLGRPPRAGRAEVVERQEATAPEAGRGVGGHSEGQLVALKSGNVRHVSGPPVR